MLTDNPNVPLILLVEEDDNHAELMKKSLQDAEEEYSLEIAGTLNDARKAIGKQTPNILLTEYQLPDGVGSELVAAVNGLCPVVLVTSQDNAQMAVEAMKAGALDYVVKSSAVFSGMSRIAQRGLREWSLIQGNKRAEQTEESLKTFSKRQNAILAAIPDIIMEVDTNKVYTWSNSVGLEFFGEDVIGKEAAYYFERDMTTYEIVKPLFEGMEKVLYVESWQRRKDGEIRLLAWWCKALEDEHGSVTGTLSTARDITEQKRLESKIVSLSEILENSLNEIYILDSESLNFLFVNNGALKNLGFTREEMLVLTPLDIKPEFTRESFLLAVNPLLTGETETMKFDTIHQRKDGTTYDVEVHLQLAVYEDKKVFTAIIIDITSRKKGEEELLRAKEAAESANIIKSQFLANMSHELRTPMNGVIGFTGLLLDTELDDDQRENAELLRKSGDNLLAIINDILDFSKIEAGKLEIEILDIDLRTILEDTAEMFAIRAADAGLELICRIDIDVPSQLKGDPGRLGQIITNLVANAIKFTHEGKVVINAEVESDQGESVMIRFSVSDTGIGIPEVKLNEIFNPFTQMDGSSTRKYGGTGLGLAICKQLVELMGGEIGVESEEGKCSIFWFTVCFEKQTVEVSSSADDFVTPQTDIEAATHEVRVLLVEDNVINQKIAQSMLNNLGYNVYLVDNGLEAIRALELINYDLVLMDCLMPEVDGFEATAMIRDPGSKVLNHAVPIIAMTANAMTGDREKCIEAGMNDYISKPVKKTELAEILLKWVKAG